MCCRLPTRRRYLITLCNYQFLQLNIKMLLKSSESYIFCSFLRFRCVSQVYVKVKDLDTGNVFLWDKNKFLIRQVHMQQTYQNFEEGGSPEPDDKVTYIVVYQSPWQRLLALRNFLQSLIGIVHSKPRFSQVAISCVYYHSTVAIFCNHHQI